MKQDPKNPIDSRFQDIDKKMKWNIFIVRHKRKLIMGSIIAGAVIVAALIVFGLYTLLKPEPECVADTDCDLGYRCRLGACVIKEGVLPPEDLEISTKDEYYFTSSGLKYDIAAQIKNPSKEWAASSFSYQFSLLGADGQEVGSVDGESFILPWEEKYIIEPAILADSKVQSIEFVITDPQWVRVGDLDEPTFSARDLQYLKGEAGSGAAEVSGHVENRTDFDYRDVIINVLLFDKSDDLVGVNRTTINSFVVGEERQFEVIWPIYLKTVDSVTTEVETDILDRDNILSGFSENLERFQLYERDPEEDYSEGTESESEPREDL